MKQDKNGGTCNDNENGLKGRFTPINNAQMDESGYNWRNLDKIGRNRSGMVAYGYRGTGWRQSGYKQVYGTE